MRQPGICRRRRDGHYYCTIDGTQIPLGNDLEKAQKKFHREMLKRRPRGGIVEADATVAVLIERFLIWVEVNRDARTLEWYSRFLSSLKYDLDARELKPSHVERWLEAIPEGSHYMAVRALQRLYNWAVKQRILEVNPIKGIDRPTHEPREVYIEPEQWAAFEKTLAGPFRDLAMFMRWTGCRPQEVRAIEARHFKGNAIEFPVKESKGKKYKRVIPLPDPALEIVKRLAEQHPTSKLFRNSKGRPWTAWTLDKAFSRRAKKLGIEIDPTAMRHTYITDALIAGMSPVVLAECVGHRSLTMIMRTYNQLKRKREELRKEMGRLIIPPILGTETPQGPPAESVSG